MLAIVNDLMPSFWVWFQLGQSSQGPQSKKDAFEPTFFSHLPHYERWVNINPVRIKAPTGMFQTHVIDSSTELASNRGTKIDIGLVDLERTTSCGWPVVNGLIESSTKGLL